MNILLGLSQILTIDDTYRFKDYVDNPKSLYIDIVGNPKSCTVVTKSFSKDWI